MSSKANQYQKKTPIEHVLLRPDTYIGDVEETTEEMWVVETDKIVKKKITFVPGFLKTFDELLVNARDASVNDKTCNTIKVDYDIENGSITVWNNGQDGIPVEEHPEHKTLVPSMIFGELLTSSNYDDNKKRTTGGRNGYGSKLANIFSTKFEVEIGDSKNGKKFCQTWETNMSIAHKAKVTKYSAKTSYVKVTYYPDFEKLHVKNGLNNDHLKLFQRRAIDITGTSILNSKEPMKVFFNGDKIPINNFKKYIESSFDTDTIYMDDSSDRWEVGVIYKPDEGNEVISFVNGISTHRGGTHVNHVVDQIIKSLTTDFINKKHKNVKVSSAIIKESLVFYINSIVENPAFSSQTKDTLTTKTSTFGSTYKPSVAMMKKLAKSGIVEKVIKLAEFKESAGLKKTDGKKQIKLKGIPKLEDANKAGSKDASSCSLILTEGDSAKAFAMAGLGIVGRDKYGVFPLKGKLLNVREASVKVIGANDEINHLKQIIGLKQNIDYSNESNFSQLRYGRIIILTDQDVDGSHIKGLLMNFLHVLWPELLKRDGFITSLATPIVKLFKGKEVKTFYNLTEHQDCIDELKSKNNLSGWKTKYYKGLGTSTSSEAKEYFYGIEDKLIQYFYNSAIKGITHTESSDNELSEDESVEELVEESKTETSEQQVPVKANGLLSIDDDAITLAFDKTRSDDRKTWLLKYNKNKILSYDQKQISYSDFIHKDLIHFSNDDTCRSIPSVIDGFKPSHRKIFYGAALRGLDKTEVKVAQLAGFVSDKAAYHHGEMSLTGAIIGMAQDYIGSNNINVLKPNGQFGTRIKGGRDAASPRYIWTEFAELTSLIFRKEDEQILDYMYEDGLRIEPECYYPIIPMVLVNGAEGIGTGFSTKCPQFNPVDIINNIINMIDNKDYITMTPWWSLFEGTVEKIDDQNYINKGNYQIIDDKVIIRELPVGEWTSNYKEYLEKLLDQESNKKNKSNINLLNYVDNNTDKRIYFELEFNKSFLSNISNVEKLLKLEKNVKLGNIHLYNKNGTIKKYKDIKDIVDEFFGIRLEVYQKRKDFIMSKLKNELDIISYKVKFILAIIDKELKINNKTKEYIEGKLEEKEFPKLSKSNTEESDKNYNYLLGMNLWSLSHEKVEELKNQHDEKETEYNNIKKQTPKTMWKLELEELLITYKKWYQIKLDDVTDIEPSVSKSKKKTITKSTKKKVVSKIV
jgi:DNA topoisomerase II